MLPFHFFFVAVNKILNPVFRGKCERDFQMVFKNGVFVFRAVLFDLLTADSDSCLFFVFFCMVIIRLKSVSMLVQGFVCIWYGCFIFYFYFITAYLNYEEKMFWKKNCIKNFFSTGNNEIKFSGNNLWLMDVARSIIFIQNNLIILKMGHHRKNIFHYEIFLRSFSVILFSPPPFFYYSLSLIFLLPKKKKKKKLKFEICYLYL